MFSWSKSCPNVSTIPLRHWGFQECLPFSWTTLRGKHCRHPIAVMGVVDPCSKKIPAHISSIAHFDGIKTFTNICLLSSNIKLLGPNIYSILKLKEKNSSFVFYWNLYLKTNSANLTILFSVNDLNTIIQCNPDLVTSYLVTNPDFVTILQKIIFLVHKNISFSDNLVFSAPSI